MNRSRRSPSGGEPRPEPHATERCIGIEIGGSKIQLGVGSPDGKLLSIERADVDLAAGADGIRRSVESLLERAIGSTPLSALGIGFGGPVDRRACRVIRSMQIDGWVDYDIRGWCEPIAGVCPILENDANAAALAEAVLGAGKDSSICFYLTLGSGLGGGLVIDGSIYHGSGPGESEVGLARTTRDGVRLEDLCSGWAVNRRIRTIAGERPGTHLADVAARFPGHEAKALAELVPAGDHDALRLLDQVADDLAFGLNHVVHLICPEVIVLGGGLSLVGEPLRERVAARIPLYLSRVFGDGPRVALAALGEEVVCRGALLLAGRTADHEERGGYHGIS